jgi:cellulose synthase/poly-beta-1,6-N-acetylglucosamine synthase-like glycosyltransferase
MTASIIVPCRNEERFIGPCLDSIVASDFPKEQLEVLVVDGMSTDGTRQIIGEFVRKHPFVQLLDNPKHVTPCAMNTGIRAARGEFILWMSAHNSYERDYISKSVKAVQEFTADNVGGIIVPTQRTPSFVGKCIVTAISHRFGVGSSFFRIHTPEPRWVDTVFGGCYRRAVFQKIGLFNEQLVRGQDMELNLRLKKAGGRILLVPGVVSYYHARSDLRSFWTHNWGNGVWAILPFAYSEIMPVSWRHLTPLVFVCSVFGTAVLSFYAPLFLWLFVAIVSAYGAANLAAALHVAWRERDLRFLALMPAIFALLHVGYGVGSLWGVVKLLGTRAFWRKMLRAKEHYGTAIG